MELQKLTTELPRMIELAEGNAKSAADICATRLPKCETVDLTKLTPQQITATDSILNDMQVQCRDLLTGIEAARKPLTQAFDMFKKENFISNENIIDAYIGRIATVRSKIAAEVKRRKDELEAAAQKSLNAERELIEARTAFNAHMQTEALTLIANTEKSMAEKFYASADLDLFAKNLQEWQPGLTLTDETINIWSRCFKWAWLYNDPVPMHINSDDIRKLINDHLLPKKQELLEAIPARKEFLEKLLTEGGDPELRGTIDERAIQDAKNKADSSLTAGIASIQEQAEITAKAEALNATFIAGANIADNIPQQASGTRQKQVYTPSTHGHWSALLMWYVSSEFPHLTPEELTKKFSFVLTKANNLLNATGEMIVGVPTEDDFSVSGRKKKK